MRRRIISMLLASIMVLSSIAVVIPASAKENLPSISSSKPIYTYTYNSSGKVYRYTDSSLKTKESGHWIDCAKDQCKIVEIQNNAVKVKYPTPSGEKPGWFRRSDFCKGDLKADQAQYSFKATKQITTYKWKENNTTYGYISKGDKVYLLRGSQNSDWLQVLYPVSGGYKMAWVKGNDLFASSIKLNKTSISRQGIGWSETLTATLSPSDSADAVTWTSANSGVATVSGSGVVKAVGYGKTTITATTKRGKTASATVEVVQPAKPKHNVDLNATVDGQVWWSLGDVATADVYIDGRQVANDVSDYCTEWPEGTRYEVKDIRAKSGYTYTGAQNGGIAGTVGSGDVDMRLVFSKVVQRAAYISDGWYMIESGNSSSRVLDINNWSMTNGGNLETYQKNGTSNQVFYVQNRGNGYYSIMTAHSGYYLHTSNTSYTERDNVHQWQGYGANNTQWALEDAGNGYFYVRSKSGTYLDNSNGSTQLGNNVGTYPLNYSAAQKWKFIRYDRPIFNGNISNHNALKGSYNKNSSKQISAQLEMTYPVTKLEVVVYNNSGKNMGMTGTYYPNARVFNLTHTFNFSQLAAGSYYYRIISYNIHGDKSSTEKFSFSVKNSEVAPTGISINSGNFSMSVGQSPKTLSATVSPSNATNKSVTWTSSNTKVATVDKNGKVTAKGAGSATITAKTVNGKTASVKVSVKATAQNKGTYPDKNKSLECSPYFKNSIGKRSASNYNTVINQFNVETRGRYKKTSSSTFCNIFAWDVMSAMGVDLPHWVLNNKPATSKTKGANELNANATYEWVTKYGSKYGWKKVNAYDAQKRANKGYPTVAIWKNPNEKKSGHIMVVRPETKDYTYSKMNSPVIAQAGATNKNYWYVKSALGNKQVVYFTHD